MNKPTRDAVEEMLNDFEVHELIGSRRDVYELVVSVFKGYLAQAKHIQALVKENDALKEVNDRRLELIAMVEQLKAENQALNAKLKGTFEFAEPQRGRPMPYPIDEEGD